MDAWRIHRGQGMGSWPLSGPHPLRPPSLLPARLCPASVATFVSSCGAFSNGFGRYFRGKREQMARTSV
jgi:hypothetical protein